MNTRPLRSLQVAGVTLLAAAALALTGCAADDSNGDGSGSTGADTAPALGECSGVRVVVDPGELDADVIDTCVETSSPVTAIEAFEAANVELEGVATSDMFFACRVAELPSATDALEYEGESYTADCADFGPVWAWWGLFEDTGDGWVFAQEGAETLEVAPGEAVAFAFQFGDTTEPRLPLE